MYNNGLGPTPKTNPSTDRFQFPACYTGSNIRGLGMRLIQQIFPGNMMHMQTKLSLCMCVRLAGLKTPPSSCAVCAVTGSQADGGCN